MPTPVENYIFNELPRRFVADSSLATGSSLTASWLLVATGSGFQVTLVNPATLGFEPELTAGTAAQYYRGDKTWATLDAAAVGAIATSQKGQALGVATLDADGYVELSQINPAVIERVVVVADEAARYALTTVQVQNGDVVNQQLDGNNDPKPSMWFVYDDTNLNNSSGYLPFSAGVAASVQWSGVSGKPAIIGDLEAIANPNDKNILWFQDGSLVVTDIDTLKTELALGISDIDELQDTLGGKQDQTEILDRLSELPTQVNKFGILVRDTDGYFQGREVVGTNGITVTEGDGNADNISVGLTEVGTAGTYGDDDNFPVYEVNAYGQVIGTTTKSLVKDTLTLLDQVADQTLVANTTYEIGEYTNTLNLLMPDPVPGGTTVTLAVSMVLAAPVGNITVVFPTGKELFGFLPSISLKNTLLPLPGDKIVFVYVSSPSKWVVYKTGGFYKNLFYLVGTLSSNPNLDPSIRHSFISKATEARTVSFPDTNIDLSAVGQTEFFDSQFRIKDYTTRTKKIAFNCSGITAGETSFVTVPDHDVDLGNITEVLNVADGESISVEANRNYHIVASGDFTINADLLSAGNIVQITSVLDSSASPITVTFSGISSYFSEVGGSAGSASLYPASSITLWRKTSGVFYRRTGVQFAAEFMLRKDGDSNLRTTFDNSAITSNIVVTLPDANVDLGLVGQTDFLDTAFRVSDNDDATKKIAFEASGIATGETRTITMPNADVDLGNVAQAVSASVNGYFTASDYKKTIPKVVDITSDTTYTIPALDGTRNHIFLTTSNFTLDAQNLQPYASAVIRSKDGNEYTVTRGSLSTWGFAGASTNPPTVSAGNDFYLSGNQGSSHTCYMTGSFNTSNFSIRKAGAGGNYFTFAAPNLTGSKIITMPNRNVDLDGIPFVNNNSGSLGISSNQVNYLLGKAGDYSFSLPITYASTGLNTIFILKNNGLSTMPILVNFTWSGQSGGFSLSPVVGFSDQSTTTIVEDYPLENPLNISGASGNKVFRIGNIPASGSAIIGIYANGSQNFRLQVTYIDGQKLGANNSNLKICKNLSNEDVATTINAVSLTSANTLTLADKNVDLGDLPSVATTNGNIINVGAVRCNIVGGQNNNVSGTDNVVVGSSNSSIAGTNVGCLISGSSRVRMIDGGDYNQAYGALGDLSVIGAEFSTSGNRNLVFGSLCSNNTASGCIVAGTSYDNFIFGTKANYTQTNILSGTTNTCTLIGVGGGINLVSCTNSVLIGLGGSSTSSTTWTGNTNIIQIGSSLPVGFPANNSTYSGIGSGENGYNGHFRLYTSTAGQNLVLTTDGSATATVSNTPNIEVGANIYDIDIFITKGIQRLAVLRRRVFVHLSYTYGNFIQVDTVGTDIIPDGDIPTVNITIAALSPERLKLECSATNSSLVAYTDLMAYASVTLKTF